MTETDWNDENITAETNCSVCGEYTECQYLGDLRISELGDGDDDNPQDWICLDCQKSRFMDL